MSSCKSSILETDALFFQALDCQYRNGDKVIHLVNDAESNVFNGDISQHHRPLAS